MWSSGFAMSMTKGRDSARRLAAAIAKAEVNEAAAAAMARHDAELRARLIRTDADRDFYQDAYLRITAKWSPPADFVADFVAEFHRVKLSYTLDDRRAAKLNEAVASSFITDEEPPESVGGSVFDVEKLKQYALLEKSTQKAARGRKR